MLTIELIFAELLQVAHNVNEIDLLKNYFSLVQKAKVNHLSLIAAEFSQKEKLLNKGIGLIDACIITATMITNSKLWTLDRKLISFMDKRFLYTT